MRAPAQPRARRERPKNAPVTRTRTRTRRERSRPGSSRRPDASSATRTGEVVARHAAAHGAEIRALTGCLLRPHTAHAHAHAHATMHMLSSEACHAEVEAIPAKAQPHPAVSRPAGSSVATMHCDVAPSARRRRRNFLPTRAEGRKPCKKTVTSVDLATHKRASWCSRQWPCSW
jgi:hypothetical protein